MLYLRDTAFSDLMQRRIFNVLLIASPYDAFIMEEDGRVEEQLYFEYVSLNLSSPPRVWLKHFPASGRSNRSVRIPPWSFSHRSARK